MAGPTLGLPFELLREVRYFMIMKYFASLIEEYITKSSALDIYAVSLPGDTHNM